LSAEIHVDAEGRRLEEEARRKKNWKRWGPYLVLFHEYFHGDNGRGVGASHQTGWTALAVRFLEEQAQTPSAAEDSGRP
jgi:hypothetical protein